jgi:hypothetical protein
VVGLGLFVHEGLRWKDVGKLKIAWEDEG